ncbi:uracil-DNA glycosylase family protein [Zymomonas sp.]|uniref:uracil-DNA glycosylase family protein n=1 Tax=Zymomonas sp. TaxID=2068624 RepID=UPI0025F28ADA|nr:uracil-DNA glycosylase family protein [Zymomonas sp.]MCA1955317.1 uracil-DNA glycosylase [Zymomonas sp.]
MAFKSLLEWWQQAGVDILTQDIPQNWFLDNPSENSLFKRKSRHSNNKKIIKNNFQSKNKDSNIENNKETLAPSNSIKTIPQNLSDFRLWLQNIFGKNCIFSDIKISPKLMILSEYPDIEDIEKGQLFSDRTSKFLYSMLDTLSVKRQDIYFATMSPIVAHIDRLNMSSNIEDNSINFYDYSLIAMQHIALIKPKYLLLLGDAPNRALLQMNAMDARRKIHVITTNNDNIKAFALLHPKMLLGTPSLKAIAWKDLRVLKGMIDEKTNTAI